MKQLNRFLPAFTSVFLAATIGACGSEAMPELSETTDEITGTSCDLASPIQVAWNQSDPFPSTASSCDQAAASTPGMQSSCTPVCSGVPTGSVYQRCDVLMCTTSGNTCFCNARIEYLVHKPTPSATAQRECISGNWVVEFSWNAAVSQTNGPADYYEVRDPVGRVTRYESPSCPTVSPGPHQVRACWNNRSCSPYSAPQSRAGGRCNINPH